MSSEPAQEVVVTSPATPEAAAPGAVVVARGLMYALVQRFQPEWTEQRSLDRGDGE